MQMHELLSYLNRKGILSILVMAQQGLIGHMHSPIDLSYLTDTVVLLRYFEFRGAVKKAISVIKKRSGAHEETIREFRLSSNGIFVGPPLSAVSGCINRSANLHRGVGSVAREGWPACTPMKRARDEITRTRVLILTPVGRDAALACGVLEREQLSAGDLPQCRAFDLEAARGRGNRRHCR